MTKKLIAVLLAALFALSVIPFVYAAGTPKIIVSSDEAKPGDNVTLTVSMVNNPGINTFSLGFDYDTTRLNLTNVTLSSNLGGQFAYSKKAVWLNSSDTTYNGEILILTFKVLDSASIGDAKVAVTYSAGDIANYDEEDVDFTLVAGKITVKKEAVQNGSISVSSATASPNAEVTLSVSMNDNPGINTFSLGFDYDTTKLNLINVELSSNLGGQFAYSKKAVWLNSTDTTYNGEILKLTFKVLDSASEGDTAVAVTYSAGDIANYDEEDVNFNLIPGKVTIEKEIIVAPDAPQIVVSTARATAGKTVDVTISLNNNPGIVNMILNVSYDKALTLKNVTDASNLGTAMHTPNYTLNPYQLTWANDTEPADFKTNGTIVTLTFEVNETAEDGMYEIAVSYDNKNYDIINFDFETVDFDTVSGGVEVVSYTVGDVNGDGSINAADRMILSRYLAKWDGYEEQIVDMRAADINGDGSVNTADRMLLARYLAKWDGYASYFE